MKPTLKRDPAHQNLSKIAPVLIDIWHFRYLRKREEARTPNTDFHMHP